MVKHYALNNQEYNRHNASSDVDERTMREIYLPAFEAAVTQGHVDAVMNSYNLINGVHAPQNEYLNLKGLKGEWGFKGILMSDWDATYDAVEAANKGLDLEMPGARFMNEKNLLAVRSGAVKESTIDDKVLRLFRTILRYGFLDRPQFDDTVSTYSMADRAVALEGALESITLLKNDNRTLPLDPARIKTIAIIGPDAYPAVSGGGGSSKANAFEPVSILTGIANLLGPDVHVLYSPGLPEMNDVLRGMQWEGSVKVEVFPSADFTGSSKTSTIRSISSRTPNPRDAEETTPHSIRYTAAFKAAKSGHYLLLAGAGGGESFKVVCNGKEELVQPQSEGQVPLNKTIELTAGQSIHVVAEYVPHSSGSRFGLDLAYEPDLFSEEAKKFAARADVAIVAAGFNQFTEGEGHDRTFSLPWGQDALIEAIADANPHTVVALIGGGPMNTRGWLDKIPALLHAFYPGREGGTAVAEVIFGKHNPEGKLPVSFDRSWEENPSAAYYYPAQAADTSLQVTETDGHTVHYDIAHIKYEDKLMVGYRYWTTSGKHPLYPFGFGLSYTTFSFSKLQVPAEATGGDTVPVSFDVTNTGNIAGAEVAQVYVSDPSAKALRPERELKGFEKVRLAPGNTRHVTLNLDARAFSYWDEAAHKWGIDPGKFVLYVGNSSESTPLRADLILK